MPCNNRLTDEELAEVTDGLTQHRWTHSITLGVAGTNISYGDVWTSAQNGLWKLTQKDPTATYAVWVCSNIQDTGEDGRPHAHGVISTTLPQYKVDSCFYSFYSYRLKAVDANHPLTGWCEYFLPQAIRNANLTNVVHGELV
jgi:hypothetical protein